MLSAINDDVHNNYVFMNFPYINYSHFLIFIVFIIIRSKHELDRDEFMFFLTGGVGLENKLANPAPTWLVDKSWDEICRASDLKPLKKFRYL